MELKKSKFNKVAFTLIELVVAMTVFSIFIAVVSSSYLFISRTLRDSQLSQEMNADVIFIMDKIIDEIRVSSIDFDCYSGNESICSEVELSAENLDSDGVLSSTYLVLLSPDKQTRTFFRVKDSKIQIFKQQKQNDIWISASGFEDLDDQSSGFQDLSSDKLTVSKGIFQISPNLDPYSDKKGLKYQPQVMIDFEFESGGQIRQEIKIPIKTTISTRYYGNSKF